MSDDPESPRKSSEIGVNEAVTATSVTPSSTSDGGKTQPFVDSGRIRTDGNGAAADSDNADTAEANTVDAHDLARAALAGAQGMARPSRGRWRPGNRRRTSDDATGGAARGGYSGPRPDETDPQPIGGLIAGYMAERGWDRPLAEARVFADWASLVGQDIAAHSTPIALQDGELRVSAESTAWATQLRLLAPTVLSRLVAELGPDVVRRIRFTGPTGPSWKHGGLSVRGARGPRDTYG